MIRVELGSGHWEIWSEPEAGDVAVGRCLGGGATLDEAKAEARKELEKDRAQLDALLPDLPVCWDCGRPVEVDSDGSAKKPCGHASVLIVPADYWLRLRSRASLPALPTEADEIRRRGCICPCCDHSEGSDCACDCHATGACSAAEVKR